MGLYNDFIHQHPRIEAFTYLVRPWLPPLNFITLHYLYFIVVCLVASLIFWGSSNPRGSISYVDSLFLVISAMTEAGLNTVNLSEMTSFQQVILWILIIIGGSIWVSIWTVLFRKHVFETRFEYIVRRSRQKKEGSLEKRRTQDLPIMQKIRTFGKSRTLSLTRDLHDGYPLGHREKSERQLPISSPVAMQKMSEPVPAWDMEQDLERGPGTFPMSISSSEIAITPEDPSAPDHIAFAHDVDAPPHSKGKSSAVDSGHHAICRNVPSIGDTNANADASKLRRHLHEHDFLNAEKVGRNAQFHDLTSEERELLGGTEYRAIKVLSVVVPAYFILWHIFGCIGLGAWIAVYQPQPARDNAMNPWWNGIFNGASAFNNSGMSVLDANMIPYGSSYFVLVVMGACILAGNTAYPVFLRLCLWTILKLLDLLTYENTHQDLKHTLKYILKYPRRVYTNLFPARTTWWLVFMLFVLNGTDWVAFEILNLGNPALDHIPLGSRIIDGLFQALAVRSGGFYVVSIPSLYIGLQVLYVIMMYISVYPVVITMRHSNVYEERSLGIYDDEAEILTASSNRGQSTVSKTASGFFADTLRRTLPEWHGVGAARPHNATEAESRISFISHQIRGQLTHDLWLLVIAVLFITTIETQHFLEDPVNYSVFNVVFEVVSAYGCVGISQGVPNNAYSFSGGMYTGSKLILCLVMLRGRHRGLPVALDRAVRLPGDNMVRDEEEDHAIRRSMSVRRPSGDAGSRI